MQSLVCCGLGELFHVGFQSLLQYFGSTPKPIFLFGDLFKKWYSTDVAALKVFADRARSIFGCYLAGGKNTFFTQCNEELGLSKVGASS